MQHPDEGQIHAWLDGALGTEESSALETHVNQCSKCAAAVAEARGLIAGASRILTALDDVPHVAVPVTRGHRKVSPYVLRIAAVALVAVAVSATLANFTDRGNDPEARDAEAVVMESAAPEVRNESAPAATAPLVTRTGTTAAPPRATAIASDQAAVASRTGIVRAEADAAAPTSQMRIVSVDSTGGGRRTEIQVRPGVAVTLAEASTALFGMATGTQMRAARTAAPAAPAPAAAVESSNGINQIQWIDSESGKVFTLSGRLSVSELTALRPGIEALRTSAPQSR